MAQTVPLERYADTDQFRSPVPPVRNLSAFAEPTYAPTRWTRPNCRDPAKYPAWADHPDPRQVPAAVWAHRTRNGRFPLTFNAEGAPLNPAGPTGVAERGSYGEHGPNWSVDCLITRDAVDASGKLRLNARGKPLMEVVTLDRADKGKGGGSAVAIPGGMENKILKGGVVVAEATFATAAREYGEEVAGLAAESDAVAAEDPTDLLQQAFKAAVDLFEGQVRGDPRETDNAWGMTLVKHIHDIKGVFSRVPLKTTKESTDSKWTLYDPDEPGVFFADHGKYIQAGYGRIYAEYL
jgi:hypothetical protein